MRRRIGWSRLEVADREVADGHAVFGYDLCMRKMFAAILATALLAACSGAGPAQLSLEELEPLAREGNMNAQYNMGVMYQDGDGVERDLTKAREWLSAAAAQGHILANFNLGVMYYAGEGVDQDLATAKGYFQRAADAGNPNAQFNLGVMAYHGQNGPVDYKTAAEEFQKAAFQGMPDAAYNLGVMFIKGEGVEKNDVQALAWFKVAADLGDDKAPIAVAEASKNIPEEAEPEVEAAYENLKKLVQPALEEPEAL